MQISTLPFEIDMELVISFDNLVENLRSWAALQLFLLVQLICRT